MKPFLILISALILSAGCSTTRVTHVMTGTVRGSVDSDTVKVYSSMPAGAQSIAVISVTDHKHHDQDGMDSALNRLKDEAASMGANGVVIMTLFSTENTGAVLSGNAVYVP